VRVTASWLTTTGVDVDALLLSGDGRVRAEGDFVFYNQLEAEDGAVRLLGKATFDEQAQDRLFVGLADLPEAVHGVLLALSLDAEQRLGLGAVDQLAVRVSSADEQPVLGYRVEGLADETVAVLGELYRRQGGWRFRAVGQGYSAGLAGLATGYGIRVNAEDEQPDEPVSDAGAPEPGQNQEAVASNDPGVAGAAQVDDSQLVDAEPDPVVLGEQPSVALPVPPAVAQAPGPARARAGIRTGKKRPTAAPVRALSLAEDDTWRAARLFPVVGIGAQEEQERRATSALLAVVMGVREFGRSLTQRLGAPAGLVETYLEVQFARGDSVVIPDGVLRVERGGRRWTALLEVKTGPNLLVKQQVENYLDVARERSYDAVVTLSNELVAAPGEHPVGVDRRKLRKVALQHLAWAEVLYEATMQLSHRGVADPTQRWVLNELVRYLRHPRSGASGFEDMGQAWVPVREAVVAGTLRSSDRKAAAVAESWERLVRQVCLRLSGDLGVDVAPVGARRAAADPAARTALHVKSLADQGKPVDAPLRIPGAVGPLKLTADIRTGQVETGVDVAAPQEGRPLTRVNWLLRQLSEAPSGLRIDALAEASSDSRCELLDKARQDPKLLVPDSGRKGYALSLTQPLGTKREIGRGGFITSIHGAVDAFYRDVMQSIRPWSPPPPKPPAHDAAAGEDQPEATDDGSPVVEQ
jgi:stress response protein SCP2